MGLSVYLIDIRVEYREKHKRINDTHECVEQSIK